MAPHPAGTHPALQEDTTPSAFNASHSPSRDSAPCHDAGNDGHRRPYAWPLALGQPQRFTPWSMASSCARLGFTNPTACSSWANPFPVRDMGYGRRAHGTSPNGAGRPPRLRAFPQFRPRQSTSPERANRNDWRSCGFQPTCLPRLESSRRSAEGSFRTTIRRARNGWWFWAIGSGSGNTMRILGSLDPPSCWTTKPAPWSGCFRPGFIFRTPMR